MVGRYDSMVKVGGSVPRITTEIHRLLEGAIPLSSVFAVRFRKTLLLSPQKIK